MSTLTDMGKKHVEGMDESKFKKSDKPGFGGTLLDLGQKKAEGMEDKKSRLRRIDFGYG